MKRINIFQFSGHFLLLCHTLHQNRTSQIIKNVVSAIPNLRDTSYQEKYIIFLLFYIPELSFMFVIVKNITITQYLWRSRKFDENT